MLLRQIRQLRVPLFIQIGLGHLRKGCNLGHLLSPKLEDIVLEEMEGNQDLARQETLVN